MSANSTAGTNTEDAIMAAQSYVNEGYVGAIIPFLVLAFILGTLAQFLHWRERASRRLNARYGAHWRQKNQARQDLIREEKAKVDWKFSPADDLEKLYPLPESAR
jgi:hypothetical protein